ncbi:MAG TPA: hypothetical protein VJA16_21485 [Thermoanaerobaculia bacterium]
MSLSVEEKQSLGVALNEARLLGVELDPERRLAAATLAVHTLPETGPGPPDSRVQLLFSPVGRLAASLRRGAWNDPAAEVETFSLDQLLGIVQSCRGPVYGWEFFDLHDEQLRRWGDRLSLDFRAGDDGLSHSILLFQEFDTPQRHLDLLIWFDRLEVRDPADRPLTLAEFAAGGKRWWDGLYAGDPRTAGAGIMPLNTTTHGGLSSQEGTPSMGGGFIYRSADSGEAQASAVTPSSEATDDP